MVDSRELRAKAAEYRQRLESTQAELQRQNAAASNVPHSQHRASGEATGAPVPDQRASWEIQQLLAGGPEKERRGVDAALAAGAGARRRQHVAAVQAVVHEIINEWVRAARAPGLPVQLAQLYTFGSFLLGVDTADSDVDMLVVVPKDLGRDAGFFTPAAEMTNGDRGGAPRRTLAQTFAEDARVEKLIEVRDAFVPCLKLRLNGVDVDLTFANVLPAAEKGSAVPRQVEGTAGWNSNPAEFLGWSDALLEELVGEVQTLRAINGVRTSHWIMQTVPSRDSFQTVLLCVKRWAQARGVYGTVMGFLGGISWALLTAYICREHPAHTSPLELLRKMFNSWCAWPWPAPVELTKRVFMGDKLASLDADVWSSDGPTRSGLMPILTPVYPSMNTAFGVSRSSFNTLKEEFARAEQITDKIAAGDSGGAHSLSAAALAHPSPSTSPKWLTELMSPLRADFAQSYEHYLEVSVSEAPPMCSPLARMAREKWAELFLASLRQLLRKLEGSAAFERLRPVPPYAATPHTNQASGAGKRPRPAVAWGGGDDSSDAGSSTRALVGLICSETSSVDEMRQECEKAVRELQEQLRVRASDGGWYSSEMGLLSRVVSRPTPQAA